MNLQLCAVIVSLVVTMAVQSFAENTSSVPPASAEMPSKQTLPFTLTISGGISLGSYEAGVNWALIDFMRKLREDQDYKGQKPELKAITGASAGAINAVITAMLWCIDKDKISTLQQNGLQGENAVNENILRKAWVAVGIDELLPEENKKDNPYCNPTSPCPDFDTLKTTPETRLVDGMFARKALKPSEDMIRKLLGLQVFMKKEQFVDIALLATREVPLDIKESGITVKNQRFVFLLQFVTDENGNGHFESKPVNVDPSLGTMVYLPHNDSQHVETDDLIRLMYASSAFPVAFGKVNLSYCTGEHEPVKSSPDKICPDNTYLASADFIDGGVFDNVPLGAALSLFKARLPENLLPVEKDKEAANNFFFFISPSNRRNVTEPFKDPRWAKTRTFGINGMLKFVPGFLSAASDHELYTILRSNKWESYKEAKANSKFNLVVTDRYFPVTGSYLGHFGAFLDRPFRIFDYNAGVYDGIHDLATFMKTVNKSDNKDGKEVQNIYNKLGLNEGSPASEVFTLIATQEHHKDYLDPESGWRWINDQLPDPTGEPSTMYIIFKSIIQASKVPLTDDDGIAAFNDFIMRLHENDYIKHDNHSDVMEWIIKKHDEDFTVWYAPLVDRAGRRLQNLQAFESDINNKNGLRWIASGISLGLGRYFNYADTFLFQPTSIPEDERPLPKLLYNLIPYELGFDMANGGISISYLGRLMLPFPKLSLDLKLTPAGYNKFGDDRVRFSQADLYISVNRVYDILSFGLGPTVNYLWRGTDEYNRANIGTALFAEFFQTLRLTIGVKDNNSPNLFGHNYYVTLGIADLPGMANRIVNRRSKSSGAR